MRFGMIMTNQHPPGESLAERFDDTIEQVRVARELGFDLITFGQHFLLNEFQMLQPAIAASRLAAEAGSMRIGITVYLLPLLNPVAVAEEVASLDVITAGRFIFGIGLGYREMEDQAFGLGPDERVRRLRAHLDVIKRLWAGLPVDFETPYCRLEGATTALRPVQQPHPSIWVAANNDRAVERAAEIGDTWIINPHATWGQHRALPGDDDMTQAFDELVRDRFIIGDPASCADEIQRCAGAVGANTMIFRVHWPRMPQAGILRGMRLLAEQVRPRVS